MEVTQSEFIISAVKPSQYPQDGFPEIAMVGRSNVGKSSLINRLINRKNLARTSSTPGKTQLLNYYLINQQLFLVDLPGYGYAKVPKSVKHQWGEMIEEYLLERKPLRMVLQVLDVRHPPTEEDRAMNDWLRHYDVPVCLVVTKADKIPKGKWQKHVKIIRETMNLHEDHPIVLVSSETGLGKEDLWHVIDNVIQEGAL